MGSAALAAAAPSVPSASARPVPQDVSAAMASPRPHALMPRAAGSPASRPRSNRWRCRHTGLLWPRLAAVAKSARWDARARATAMAPRACACRATVGSAASARRRCAPRTATATESARTVGFANATWAGWVRNARSHTMSAPEDAEGRARAWACHTRTSAAGRRGWRCSRGSGWCLRRREARWRRRRRRRRRSRRRRRQRRGHGERALSPPPPRACARALLATAAHGARSSPCLRRRAFTTAPAAARARQTECACARLALQARPVKRRTLSTVAALWTAADTASAGTMAGGRRLTSRRRLHAHWGTLEASHRAVACARLRGQETTAARPASKSAARMAAAAGATAS